jgi:hypothetical protein
MSTDRTVVTLDDLVRRHINDHRKPYYDWLRHLVTLCVATLTALVALQGHYVPRNAHHLWLLALCWVALTGAIFLGMVALRQEYLSPLEAAQRIQDSRAIHGDSKTAILVANRELQVTPPRHHRLAVKLMLPMFFLALLCLCGFAIANMGALQG